MSTDNPMIPLSAMRAIAVEAIRAVTGCPDIRGNEGLYLVDELEAVAKAAAARLNVLDRFRFEVVINKSIPAGVVRLYQDGKLVGEVTNIADQKR